MSPSPEIQVQAIENHQAVLQKFGRWPSFHDSEIHSILMDRDGPDGPSLEMCVHIFTWTDDLDRDGGCILDKQVIVTLRFSAIDSEEIVGFNEQNAIFDLHMRADQDRIAVALSSSYGCAGSFTCKRISVKSVQDYPGKPGR